MRSSDKVNGYENDALVIRTDSPHVCISFSSRNTDPGKFTLYKMLGNFGASLIFVNDYSNKWFLNGTPAFPNEVLFINWLRKEVDKLLQPGGKLFTVGASMGAYGALKYGALLGADKILALGPETELGLPYSRSAVSLKGMAIGFSDITGLHYRNASDVVVISGSNDIVDVYCAASVKEANPLLNVSLIRNRTHEVAKYINSKFGLPEVLSSFFLKGDVSFIRESERTPVPSAADASILRLFNESLSEGKVELNYENTIRKIADVDKKWSLPRHYLGLISEEKGDMKEAERFYLQALQAQKSLQRARLRLAQLLNKQSRWSEALDVLLQIPEEKHTVSVKQALDTARAAQNR